MMTMLNNPHSLIGQLRRPRGAFTPCGPFVMDLSPIGDWPRPEVFADSPDADIISGDIKTFDSIDGLIDDLSE